MQLRFPKYLLLFFMAAILAACSPEAEPTVDVPTQTAAAKPDEPIGSNVLPEETIPAMDTVKPEIRGVADHTVQAGQNPDYLAGVTASDNMDGDLTAQIRLDLSKVQLDQAGTYEIVYSVEDSSGNVANESATVTVEEAEASIEARESTDRAAAQNDAPETPVVSEWKTDLEFGEDPYLAQLAGEYSDLITISGESISAESAEISRLDGFGYYLKLNVAPEQLTGLDKIVILEVMRRTSPDAEALYDLFTKIYLTGFPNMSELNSYMNTQAAVGKYSAIFVNDQDQVYDFQWSIQLQDL